MTYKRLPKITGRVMRQIKEAMLTRNEQPNAFNQRPKCQIWNNQTL